MQTVKLELSLDLAALSQSFNQPLEKSARELMTLELYQNQMEVKR